MLGALLFCVAAGARIFAAQIRRYFFITLFFIARHRTATF